MLPVLPSPSFVFLRFLFLPFFYSYVVSSLYTFSFLRPSLIQRKVVLPVVALHLLGSTRRQFGVCLRMTLLRICGIIHRFLILTDSPGYRLPGLRNPSR